MDAKIALQWVVIVLMLLAIYTQIRNKESTLTTLLLWISLALSGIVGLM